MRISDWSSDVCSSDLLVRWCGEVSRLYDAREYDVVVASGEQVTVGLLAMALQDIGVNARSWLGWKIPFRTDGIHGKARIARNETAEMENRLSHGQAAGVAGSQGVGPDARKIGQASGRERVCQYV